MRELKTDLAPIRELLTGQGPMRDLLSGLAPLYGQLVGLERKFFEMFSFLVERPAARVISIGNLSVGGTGKTPVLLELLLDAHIRKGAVVLSRGYRCPWERGFYLLRGTGAQPASMTDEALLLNQYFPELPIFIGKNRAHAARQAQTWFSPTTMFLDDGFQYRRLRHDVDLVLWDAAISRADCNLLPGGNLREPLDRLREATVLLLTRADQVSSETLREQENLLRAAAPGIPILPVAFRPVGWLDPLGRRVPLAEGPRTGFVLTAIAKPQAFQQTLADIGCVVKDSRCRRDHDRFSDTELEQVALAAKRVDAVPVCTEKDLVKISRKQCQALGYWCLTIRPTLLSGDPLIVALRDLGIL